MRPILRFLLALSLTWWFVASATANERLRVTDLKENEFVVITFTSRTGERMIGREYFIRGGESKVMTAHRNMLEVRNRVPHVTAKFLLGDLVLSPDEVLGLESLIVFYAARIPGNCRTQDVAQVEFYRDGKSVGVFLFEDNTCFLSSRDEASTRAKIRSHISEVVFESIISLPEFDARIRAANPD